jgi:hypothetical protein
VLSPIVFIGVRSQTLFEGQQSEQKVLGIAQLENYVSKSYRTINQ